MMYKLKASVALLCASFASHAGDYDTRLPDTLTPEAALQVAHPEKTLFTDLVFNGTSYVAVGKHGTIVISKDGENWAQGNSPVQSLLTAVNFTDAQQGWACGHDATILHTQDGGNNWTIQQYLPEVDKPCLDIAFTDEKHGIAIGAYGMLYETTDAGEHWHKRFLDDLLLEDDKVYLADLKESDPATYKDETAFMLPHFNRFAAKGDTWIIVGEMGLVAVSQNKGETWTRLNEFYNGSFFDVAINNKNEVIVAGLRGNAFVTTFDELLNDSWQRIELNKTSTINSIVESEGKEILVANSGLIFIRNGEQIETISMKSGKSILSAVATNGKLILATESGLKSVENKN
ncbi:WD40/YVTN/BNR-like repeat-containing protein [Pseudoalteromonas xiamenensis]